MRMVAEDRGDHDPEWAAMTSGCEAARSQDLRDGAASDPLGRDPPTARQPFNTTGRRPETTSVRRRPDRRASARLRTASCSANGSVARCWPAGGSTNVIDNRPARRWLALDATSPAMRLARPWSSVSGSVDRRAVVMAAGRRISA